MKTKLFLFAALLLCMPMAFATVIDGINYTLDNSTKTAAVTSNYSPKYSGDIVIPSTIEIEGITYSVTSIENYAFSGCSSLTSITLPESITSIGDYVFSSCSSLISITIPESVTSIGNGIFQNCSGLASITLPESITSIGNYVFSGCSSLTSIDLPKTVTSIGYCAFQYCSNLTSITIPESITSIENSVFSGCSSLISITIPEGVTSVGNSAFYNCSILSSVTIPEGVTSIGNSAFTNCTSLASIVFKPTTPPTLSDASLAPIQTVCLVPIEVLEVYRTAEYYSTFASRILPNNPMSVVTISANGSKSSLNDALGEANLQNIYSLKINGSINGYDIMIMRNKMINLRELDLTDCDIVANDNGYEYYTGYHSRKDTLTSYSFTYENNSGSKLSKVKLPKSLRFIQSNCFNPSTLTSIEINGGNIGNYAFKKYTKLSEVKINNNESTTSIGDFAFTKTPIREITIPKCVETIGAFAFASDTTNYSTYNTPEGLKYSSYSYVVSRETKLQSVIFEEGSPVTTFNNYVFAGRAGIKEFVFPENITTINRHALSYIDVDTLVIPNTVKNIAVLGLYKASCKRIVLPENLTYINQGAFHSCAQIDSIVIPSSVDTIGAYAFYGCTNLKSLNIPSTVRMLGNYAFGNCTNVESVYTYTLAPTNIDQNTFSCWRNAYLYIPFQSRTHYFYNTQWSQFLGMRDVNAEFDSGYLPDGVDHTIGCDSTFAGTPNLELDAGSGLVAECEDDPQNVDTLYQNIGDGTAASIIACRNSLLGSVLRIRIEAEINRWYFFNFPFDIPFENIHHPGQMAVLEYDGEYRAQHGSGGWKKTADVKIKKQKGYAFQISRAGAIEFDILVPLFTCEALAQSLPIYTAEFSYDANWCLIGNPFPSYFDMDILFEAGFQSPVYIHNPKTNDYDVYMPHDDEYHFHPYEAFFVQNPQEIEGMFNWEGLGRETQNQAHAAHQAPQRRMARRARQAEEGRYFIELNLSDGNDSDHTRIVFNEAAKTDYELGRDAIKMEGSSPIRIYSLDDEVNYAINERPAEEQFISLGYRVDEEGIYYLSATRLDAEVEIYDNELSQEVDLTKGDYMFFTAAGTNNTRFSIKPSKVPTSIENTSISGNEEVSIYTLTGVMLHDKVRLNDIQLQAGVYVIKGAQQVEKVVVK